MNAFDEAIALVNTVGPTRATFEALRLGRDDAFRVLLDIDARQSRKTLTAHLCVLRDGTYRQPNRKSTPLAERFWPKVNKEGHPRGCWEWTGSTTQFGYGQVNPGRRGAGMWRTHRVSWMLTHGPIPDGQCVLHVCDNPLCVNPEHLFLGTRLENNRDTASKGRQWQQAKTHCKRGHPLSGDNLGSQGPDGRNRLCLACSRKSERRNKKSARPLTSKHEAAA